MFLAANCTAGFVPVPEFRRFFMTSGYFSICRANLFFVLKDYAGA